MAKNKDIMNVKERKTKNGVSLDLRCSGKDPVTRKNKVYLKTCQVPPELKGKELEAFRLKCQVEWKEEVLKIAHGQAVQKNNIKFIDFAKEWTENILKRNKESFNHYIASKHRLKVLEERLGHYYLNEISPIIMQDFCLWLCERTYKKESLTVKESLMPLIAQKGLSLRMVAEQSNMSHATLFVALRVGNSISKDIAERLCNYFKVPFNNYFKIESKEVQYSKHSNNSLKVMVHGILASAVKLRLIDTNYASKDYVDAIKGTKGKKEIYNDEEVRKFVRCIDKEDDIRKRVIFSIYIYLGLRSAEVAGLEWKDFDFDTNELSIQRNTIYVGSEFGIQTKCPKSEKAIRTIIMPTILVSMLKQYKEWWDEQKINHGDLWEDTDRLFCQNNGKDMSAMTFAGWLESFQKQNGLKRVTPHGLRHTNITMLIKNGVDVKTVSGRVGHADIATTLNIYSHFTKEADKKAADRIDELLAVGF